MPERPHGVDWSTYSAYTGDPGLPPRRFLVDIDTSRPKDFYHSIETPTDERGLVDIPELIKIVKGCVVSNYVWPEEPSVHHFYHPASNYPHVPDVGERNNPSVFRNLPIHKGLVPRQFENILHWVVKEPSIPSAEVRQYRVDAWSVAKDLFKMARDTVQWEKKAERRRKLVASNPEILKEEFSGEDIIGEEIMEEVFARNFRGLEYQLQRHEQIPREFHLVDLGASPQELAKGLGKLVVPGAMKLVNAVAA